MNKTNAQYIHEDKIEELEIKANEAWENRLIC